VQEESVDLGIPCLTRSEKTAMLITTADKSSRVLKTDFRAQPCAGALRTRIGI